MRKKGFNDEDKLRGMVKRANELAVKQNKNKKPSPAQYKEDVVGILQSFFMRKEEVDIKPITRSVSEQFINSILEDN